MTDNLNKADEDLMYAIYQRFSENKGLRWSKELSDEIREAIKQRDAIRDKALGERLIGSDEDSVTREWDCACGTKHTNFVDYSQRNRLRKEQRQRLAKHLKGKNPKYQLPGFEDTMSDLDKLTVKPKEK